MESVSVSINAQLGQSLESSGGGLRPIRLTLLGGWMRFLLAWAGDKKRLFFEPVNSLKLGVWSGRLKGFVTSDRKFCLENLMAWIEEGKMFWIKIVPVLLRHV